MLKRSSGIPRLPVDFPAKIKFAATMASGRNSRSHGEKSGYPPSPLPFWNHHVSRKFSAKSG